MTKEELNEKLAELYGEDGGYEIVNENKYSDSITTLLIDDWNRLMPLAIKNKLSVLPIDDSCMTILYGEGSELSEKIMNKDHESPEAAAKYAIALALVKLAESKS